MAEAAIRIAAVNAALRLRGRIMDVMVTIPL
jgi:hypothetical protein